MQILEPAGAVRRRLGSAGVVVKSLASVVAIAVGAGAEDHVGSGLDNGVEFGVLMRQFDVEKLESFGAAGEFRRALGDALFQFAVQFLKLVSLAMQFAEEADLGSKQLWDDRHGDVVDGATLI